jgi:hypothetical protein
MSAPILAPTDALGYIARLFEPNDWICFQFIRPNPVSGKTDIRSHFETLEQALKTDTLNVIKMYQEQGYNAYVAMNGYTPNVNHRREQDIQHIRTVYIEFDENGDTGLSAIAKDVGGVLPEPHFILESSPKKYYVIWLVSGFAIEQQKALNSALQKRYGSDPASVDAARVLRLPGTRNLKYTPTPVVQIIKQGTNESRYTPADFKVEITVKAEERKPSPNVSLDGPKIPMGAMTAN